jgi:phytoene dehydrogenase-like protein
MLPFDAPLSGAFGLLFTTLAHALGWPVVEGGSDRVVDALVAEVEALDGRIVTGQWVRSLEELPPARATVLDVTPRQLLAVAAGRLPSRYRRDLERFRYGPGVCKVDWALAGPVPWEAKDGREAVTLHVGGTFAEVAQAEADVAAGRHPDRPFCLVTQPCVVDPSRAPAEQHTLWAYCHVPNGSNVDMTERIEAQIERFAPGFRDLVLARVSSTAVEVERHNPSYVGGDIGAGAATLMQTVFRPTVRWNPYRTGIKGVYLCSASTPPGGGVHGMCGQGAAHTALHDLGLPADQAARVVSHQQ